MFQVGDRIELVFMPQDPDPIPPGTRGTVDHVYEYRPSHEQGYVQYGVAWDNGRTLSVIVPPDRVRAVRDEQASA